ncbi:MAG TPA: alpha/beta hydrolase, partial [Candidatus Limnocylindria bacterium]|nr:alpha/beta hydrolase [Candidatus Limnocylindria bacterium]
RLHHPIANRLRHARYPLARFGSRAILAAAALRTRLWLPDPIDRVAAVAPRPLLVIAPRDDALIHYTESVALHARAGEPKELWVVDGAGHGEAVVLGGQAYRERVLAFLERYLDRATEAAVRLSPSASNAEEPRRDPYNPGHSAQSQGAS